MACYHEYDDNGSDIYGTVEFRGWVVILEGGTERGQAGEAKRDPTLCENQRRKGLGHPRCF